MKKMTLTTAALTALLAASTTTSVFAEDAVPAPAYSTGKAILTEDVKPTDPVDPTDPGTGNDGPLSLDTVPSYDFGSKALEGGDTIFNTPKVLLADGTYADKDGHVQVTDKRGTGAGWKLTVKYVAGADGSATTTNEAWTSTDGLHIKGALLELPAATWLNTNDEAVGAPDLTKAASITDADVDYASASKDLGMGTWIGTVTSANVKLTVPQGNKVGDYKANLQWTLTDAAQA
ncbi:hypothetical protein RD055328_12280 [Companilactobacillus sp. RD055328]|uniref:WxL domain-containing protein n=1 Tax=Companilactobacillus sp. RD055328 TaxID=2916634 RepID=UPI001FC80F2F|nr:WxL domain-containing protein [Companilactobacillus sp. RD055328]GKQ43305.1 hypothetical protein RD055328_12280 [Companilactobacillus sp. RD055328]